MGFYVWTLYKSPKFGTLPRGAAAAQRTGVARAVERVARTVRAVVWPRRATRRFPAVSVRTAERQSSEIDERDAGACSRPGHVSSLPALHQPCSVGSRADLAEAARRDSGSRRRRDSGCDELSQTRDAVGWGRAPILRRVGQGRQLSGGGDRRAVDRCPRVDARRRTVSARDLADARGAAARQAAGGDPVSRKVAVGIDVAPPDPGRRLLPHRPARRCGGLRQFAAAPRPAPVAAAPCAPRLLPPA